MPHTIHENPENWLNDYGDMLYRYALARVRSETIAEDLLQETLLAGIQAITKFSGQSSVSTWLTGILKHKIIDHFRKNRHELQSLNDFELGEDLTNNQFDQQGHWQINLVEWKTPDRHLNDQQFWQVFYQCLDRLPKKMADLLLLRTMEGVSSKDCCQVLGFETTNQLWVTLSRTRMKLRQCLDVKWFEKK
jgi:RNA polymerase sigma-70 factor (ECF subfamily)